jgi:hypothetical protein
MAFLQGLMFLILGQRKVFVNKIMPARMRRSGCRFPENNGL